MKPTIIALAAFAAALAGPAAAQDQTAPQTAPMSIEDSLICAGLFYVHSTLPENASFAEGVETYRNITATFLTRAEILAGREGKPTDGHVERAAEVADMLLGQVNAAPDASARYAVIASWNELEDACIAGGQQPA